MHHHFSNPIGKAQALAFVRNAACRRTVFEMPSPMHRDGLNREHQHGAPADGIDGRALTMNWQVHRYDRSGKPTMVGDQVIQEERIELVLNGSPLLAMLALPRDVEVLALGFLVSEGLWRDRNQLPSVRYEAATGQVHCDGAFEPEALEGIHRRWTFGTGCGGGGTARSLSHLEECRPIVSRLTVRPSQLASLSREFNRRTVLYRTTGGVHACAIADPDRLLLVAEDVGRHNAFDKVAGMALAGGMDLSEKIALSTGRLSAEIVAKAIAHGVPLLCSFSAPTAMGVKWSGRFGLTLVGFLRGNRMNVYTRYDRVSAGE
ncbi:MAG: formate dehydrogenase accessory sulfurtransferase FdhD [Myxococcales bacterium]|nr:MAG: formate dehydrogenase accessory sulfurtransferase FdhD [Myxococcales bacterium]